MSSDVTVNARTGLQETVHPFFKVPLVQQRSLGGVRLGGQVTAVHSVPLGSGRSLDFYGRLGRDGELFVTFHGANKREKNFYPVFARVASMRDKSTAMMAFADPTLLLDPDREMLLAWYLGGPGWDPLVQVVQVVRAAQRKTGASRVAFIGGSGGGFAALRASAMVPGSMAFVQDPQTIIASYIPSVVEKYFEVAWPGWDAGNLMQGFPERFDMVRWYLAAKPDNFVYYAQNASDHTHVAAHLAPFKKAHGVGDNGDRTPNGNRVFALYDGSVAGHGMITAEEYDGHFAQAVGQWRSFLNA